MTAEEYLAGQRVNIELILYVNDKNILHYGVRLRPWKQETRIGAMILSQGLSVADALNKAARDLHLGRWERLDYAARPWQARNPEPDEPQSGLQLDFLEAGDAEKPELALVRTLDKARPKNTA